MLSVTWNPTEEYYELLFDAVITDDGDLSATDFVAAGGDPDPQTGATKEDFGTAILAISISPNPSAPGTTFTLTNPDTLEFAGSRRVNPGTLTGPVTAAIIAVNRTGITSVMAILWTHAIATAGTWTTNQFTTTGGLPATNTGATIDEIAGESIGIDMLGTIVTTPTAYSFAQANLLDFGDAIGPNTPQTGSVT